MQANEVTVKNLYFKMICFIIDDVLEIFWSLFCTIQLYEYVLGYLIGHTSKTLYYLVLMLRGRWERRAAMQFYSTIRISSHRQVRVGKKHTDDIRMHFSMTFSIMHTIPRLKNNHYYSLYTAASALRTSPWSQPLHLWPLLWFKKCKP